MNFDEAGEDGDEVDFLQMHLRELVVLLNDRFGVGAWKILRIKDGLIVTAPGQTIVATDGH